MSEQPNVLLVTVDSLRADHVYESAASTPSFDRLASNGTSFESAFAQGPFTTYSMPSLFTSRYPSQLTSIDFVEGVEGVLVDGVPTIQQRLREAGYTTVGIQSNPLLSETFGFDVGFDEFYSGLDGLPQWLPERVTLLADKLGRFVRRTPYVPAGDLTDRAVEWLRAADETPFFLWVHYMDVHGPYQSRAGFSYLEKYRAELLWRKAAHSPGDVTPEERQRLRETYVEEVEFTDAQFGRLFDAFDAWWGDDGLIVLTADHGDEFGEHGSYSHESKLYDELTHVPLVVRPPRSRDVAVEGSDLVPLLDVAPTILHAADATTDEFQGRSLFERNRHLDESPVPVPRDLREGTTEAADGVGQLEAPAVVSEASVDGEYVGAIRTVDWKYIHEPGSPELYDLAADPGEGTNVVDKEMSVAHVLATRLDAHRERRGGGRRDVPHLDSDVLDERLRSLGYIE